MTSGINITQPCPAPGETLTIKAVMDDDGNWTFAAHAFWRDDKGWHDRPVVPPPPAQNVVPLRRDAK